MCLVGYQVSEGIWYHVLRRSQDTSINVALRSCIALRLVYTIHVRVYNIRVAPLRTMPLHDARCCAAPFASSRISSFR